MRDQASPWVGAIVVLGLLLAGCGDDDDGSESIDASTAGHDAGSHRADAATPADDAGMHRVDAARPGDGAVADASDGTQCSDVAPHDGSYCLQPLQCADSTTPDACNRTRQGECDVEAHSWEYWRPLSCQPLARNAKCDPVGTWTVTYNFDDGDSGVLRCSPDSRATIRIRAAIHGELEALGWAGTISPDGCTMHLARSISWTNPSENGTYSYDLELDLDGPTASGPVVHSSQGFCPFGNQGTASATRTR